jgi:hypothetical protein
VNKADNITAVKKEDAILNDLCRRFRNKFKDNRDELHVGRCFSISDDFEKFIPFTGVFKFLLGVYGIDLQYLALNPFEHHCVYNALLEAKITSKENIETSLFRPCSLLGRNNDKALNFTNKFVMLFHFRKRSGKRVMFYFVGDYDNGFRTLTIRDCYSTDPDKILYPFCVAVDCIAIATSCFHIRLRAKLKNGVMKYIQTRKMFKITDRPEPVVDDTNSDEMHSYAAELHRSLIGYLLCK